MNRKAVNLIGHLKRKILTLLCKYVLLFNVNQGAFALQTVKIYTSISEVWAGGLYFSIRYGEPAWLHNKIHGQEKEKEADTDRRLTCYFHTLLDRFTEEFQIGEAEEVLLLAALF